MYVTSRRCRLHDKLRCILEPVAQDIRGPSGRFVASNCQEYFGRRPSLTSLQFTVIRRLPYTCYGCGNENGRYTHLRVESQARIEAWNDRTKMQKGDRYTHMQCCCQCLRERWWVIHVMVMFTAVHICGLRLPLWLRLWLQLSLWQWLRLWL